MRFARLLLVLILTLAFVAPFAAAQLTISPKQPTLPMPYDQPTMVDVTFSADCSTVLTAYQAMSKTELEIALDSPPAWLNFTGAKVPFTMNQCNPQTQKATSTGRLTLTPGPTAPGLEPTPVKVIAKGETGSGALSVSLSYYGTLGANTNGTDFNPKRGQVVDFTLNLRVGTNGKSMLMFIAGDLPGAGNVTGLPETVDVGPTNANASGFADVEIPLRYEAPALDWAMDNFTVSVQLMSYADASKTTDPVNVAWHFAHDVTEAEAKSGKSPAPDAISIVVALALCLWSVRRRGPA